MKITNAKIIKDKKVFIEFSDGLKGVLDLEPLLPHYGGFLELRKNPIAFSKMYIDITLCWPKPKVDLAPDTLYEWLKKYRMISNI
jgi:hypothetical protein